MNVKELDEIFHLPYNSNTYIIYSIRLNVIKNGRWAYTTYIKYYRPITEKIVRRYICQREKSFMKIDKIYRVWDGGFEYGNHISDFKGQEAWNVELKTDIDERQQYIEENYLNYQLGGYRKYYPQIDPPELDAKVYTKVGDVIKTRDYNIYNDIRKLYYIKLKIFKDGTFIENFIAEHTEPLNEQNLVKALNQINKNHGYYGYIYNVSFTWTDLLVETSKHPRFQVYYDEILEYKD
jgi:hypothetical protein